jgi:mevalonate pyrophosphate decarboxylase
MRESSNMHAVMLDTWPPITYLNDVSKEIMYKAHELNATSGEPLTAYTFDAGANAHLYTLERNEKAVREMLAGIEGVKEVRVSRIGSGPKYVGERLY